MNNYTIYNNKPDLSPHIYPRQTLKNILKNDFNIRKRFIKIRPYSCLVFFIDLSIGIDIFV